MHQCIAAFASNLMVMDKMPHNDHGNPDKLRDPEDRPISNEQELR
jgi:hypothetical protein